MKRHRDLRLYRIRVLSGPGRLGLDWLRLIGLVWMPVACLLWLACLREPALAAQESPRDDWSFPAKAAGHEKASRSSRVGPTGGVSGILTDWESHPLSGASVVLSNTATGATARTTTGKQGNYKVTGLAEGEYAIEAEVPGLGRGRVQGVVISSGYVTKLTAALRMELPEESVTRTANELNSNVVATTTTLTANEMAALPARERQWSEFVATAPGANATASVDAQVEPRDGGGSRGSDVSAESSGVGYAMSLGGSSVEPTGSRVDGVENTLAFSGKPVGSERGGYSMSQTSLRQMDMTAANVSAEVGRASGGMVDLATRRGSNELHGQAFFQDYENLWGAQNPFTQLYTETTPAIAGLTPMVPVFTATPYTPPDHRVSWGIGMGGRIRRDKLYWFSAIDGFSGNDPGLATVKHPYTETSSTIVGTTETSTIHSGFFAQPKESDMQVLAARLGLPSADPVGEGYAAYSSFLEQMNGLMGVSARTAKQTIGFTRLDWQARERHHLVVETNLAQWNSPGGALGGTEENYGSHSFGNSSARETLGLGKWEFFLNANLLSVLSVGASSNVLNTQPEAPSAWEQGLNQNAFGALPEILADSTNGFILGKAARLDGTKNPAETQFQGEEQLSWAHLRQLWKVGGSYRHATDQTNSLLNRTGTYSYANLLNFASDALTFLNYHYTDLLNPNDPHNCDPTGKSLGYLPCYASFSQTVGPADWQWSTNDLAGYATAQWQPWRRLTVSAGARFDLEQLPQPIANVANAAIPATQSLPTGGGDWGPRMGLALDLGPGAHALVMRVGAGIYYGRINNSTLQTALTQTGSPNGDQHILLRPRDYQHTGEAPPFPYELTALPATVETPGAVAFASRFHHSEIDQAVFSLEGQLPGRVRIEASAMTSLGRRLPISIDTNIDTTAAPQTITYEVEDATQLGPIKSPTLTVPFYTQRLNANYQQITSIESRANSTYEAATLRLDRFSPSGVSLHAHYTYSHAMDWNPNEGTQVAGSDVLDPQDFAAEYGTSSIDARHAGAGTLVFATPWRRRDWAMWVTNGWMLSAVGRARSGLPYTLRTGGYLPEEFTTGGAAIVGLGAGINGSGGDNRLYQVQRNTYRYPATYDADLRLGKRFSWKEDRQLELMAESFNLFNHQNVTQLETTGYTIDRGSISGGLPTLNFLNGIKAGTTAFGQPLSINGSSNFRERQIQIGARLRF